MYKLQCAEIIHTLRYKSIMICGAPDGAPEVYEASNKFRQRLVAPLVPLIHRSQKFIFDSGSDQDERTTTAVRETAVNMIEAGLFHQPFPDMWIEDPYEDNPDNQRNFYLASEKDKKIKIWSFAKLDLDFLGRNSKIDGKRVAALCLNLYPLIIDLEQPKDAFLVDGPEHISILYSKILGETVYSYKKLIVTLNTENLNIDKIRIPTGKKSWDGNPRTRPYDHSIVRVPVETFHEGNVGVLNSSEGKPRRKHLVRGFVWGKHTRPKEEQRWIKPHWRGDADVEIKERHYVVK